MSEDISKKSTENAKNYAKPLLICHSSPLNAPMSSIVPWPRTFSNDMAAILVLDKQMIFFSIL